MLTRQVGMSAVCLGLSARAGQAGTRIQELSDATGISRSSLGKIIHLLARKRLVRTRRGVGGGVTLARPAAKLTLYDLCLLLDDPIVECRCMFGFGHCSARGTCPPGCLCIAQHAKQLDFLKKTRVVDVVRMMAPCGCLPSEDTRRRRARHTA